MQWLIDIIQEWIVDQGYLLHCFIDRGDPAVVDFDVNDHTADFAWHELDLSGIVPGNAKAVLLNSVIRNTGSAKPAWYRRAGNVQTKNVTEIYSQVGGVLLGNDIVIPIGTDGKIEYVVFPGGWTILNLTVKGWWF